MKCGGHIVRTGGFDSKDKLLVTGFIRQCFKSKEFDKMQLPHIDLMMLIADRYNAEMVHWFQANKHYGMYMKDILNSLY